MNYVYLVQVTTGRHFDVTGGSTFVLVPRIVKLHFSTGRIVPVSVSAALWLYKSDFKSSIP